MKKMKKADIVNNECKKNIIVIYYKIMKVVMKNE